MKLTEEQKRVRDTYKGSEFTVEVNGVIVVKEGKKVE